MTDIRQQPDYDGEKNRSSPRFQGTLNRDTDIAPDVAVENGQQVRAEDGDAAAFINHDDNEDTTPDSKKSDLTDKDENLGPTDPLALAATQSVQEGEAHKIVKKKTYLHKSNKMYSERIQHHTFLMKTLAVLQNIWTMVSTFPYWDMAFWSG